MNAELGPANRRQPRFRRGPGSLYRRVKSLHYLATRDRSAVIDFVSSADLPLARRQRVELIARFIRITNHVRGYHTLAEMLVLARAILERPGAVVVEAGCAHGSSTAKLSLATERVGGQLHVFDSFRGMPKNNESHRLLDGRPTHFFPGAFRATLPSVTRTIDRYGCSNVCTLHKGWLEDTLASACPEKVDVAVLDVDLIASTRVCLTTLMPRMRPGGVVFSLDGQLEATHAVLADRGFWLDEVGVAPPRIRGLGTDKLLVIEATSATTISPI